MSLGITELLHAKFKINKVYILKKFVDLGENQVGFSL